MKTDYYYKVFLGLYLRNKILRWFVPGSLALIFGTSFLGDVGLAVGITAAIGGFLYIMTQYSSERNVLLFTECGLEHFRTEQGNPTVYSYEDIISFHTNHPHRGLHFLKITLVNGTAFYFNEIERAGGLDVNFNDLYRFLWHHNDTIAVTKHIMHHHYKYILQQDAILKLPA